MGHTNLHWIDWTILAVAVVGLRLVSLSTRSYMRSVADFLSANRSAGRYLLTIASQMGNTGAISIVAGFEMMYIAGFPPVFWGMMSIPVGVIMLLTGWVFYRFRETRAMTTAQYLEMRYSRRLRIFAGMLCFTGGLLNFGIFPGVAARFLMYFCGLPEHFLVPGIPFGISTFATIMLFDLALALTFVNMGGQVSIMVTECVQGIFSGIAFVIVSGTVILNYQWPKIIEALSTAPANQSMLNPFQTSGVKDFNISYFLIGIFGSFYHQNSWQGAQGFFSSARTPHEQRMGGVIALWREMPKALMALILPIVAYVVLNLPEYSAKADIINKAIGQIDNPTIQTQMKVPIVLANILPVGVKGLLATIMLFFSFTCHDTYMHSWGSIFVQDVVMPIRNRALSPEQHIKWLRWSIICVGIFAFFFSLFYQQSELIFMYFAITGVIWMGGSGAVIIGGLYWRRGTTPAAYAALITGAVVGVGGLIYPKIYVEHYGHPFPINMVWLSFLGTLCAIIVYITVSLLTGKKSNAFNLTKMLHRGEYTIASDDVKPEVPQSKWLQIVGIREEFSFTDRILAIALMCWNFGWFLFFATVTIMHLVFHAIPPTFWIKFWQVYVMMYAIIGIPATVWFTVGGIIDIRALYKHLGTLVRDHSDDGRVVAEPDRIALQIESQATDLLQEPQVSGDVESVPEES